MYMYSEKKENYCKSLF